MSSLLTHGGLNRSQGIHRASFEYPTAFKTYPSPYLSVVCSLAPFLLPPSRIPCLSPAKPSLSLKTVLLIPSYGDVCGTFVECHTFPPNPPPPRPSRIKSLSMDLFIRLCLFVGNCLLCNPDRRTALHLLAPVSPTPGVHHGTWLPLCLFMIGHDAFHGSFYLSSGKLRESLWSLLQENAPNGRGAPPLHVGKLRGLHPRKALCLWRLWRQRIQQPGNPFF